MPRASGFENKRVVIIGGSSGIGLAVAEEAASQGAEVGFVSSKAERVQEAIQSIGGAARGQVFDVSNKEAVQGFFTNLARLTTWFSLQVTVCNCTSF
jgi:NAD(P)-dependent dehydrogenase (short-subunit alcohol dehydrogenase family)